MKVAVIGATGMVGSLMLKVLEERNFPVSTLLPVASDASAGREVLFKGEPCILLTAEEALAAIPDLALFSAGADISLELAPRFAEIACTVIDNSSAWRMHPDVKLIVPEINGHTLSKEDKIISNPNCSTIQMVMVLNPLHQRYGIKRIVVSTYQSVSGTGKEAVNQLMNERSAVSGHMAYKYPIDLNVLPQIDDFLDNGYTKEEMKMLNETRKIMNDNNIMLTATTVRVPVITGHSEAVNIEFEKDFELNDIRQILSSTKGVVVLDDPARQQYPMPLFCTDKDEVFVGRIRRDISQANSLNCWIVGDNLRKGAATNAVQIAELLHQFDIHLA